MNKHYSNDFKEKATHEVIYNNRKVKDVAQELNLVPQTLYRWLQAYREGNLFIGSGNIKDQNIKRIKQLETENAILKKSSLLENNTESVFEFIYEHKDEFAISTMCSLLDVSSSGYYKWLKSTPSSEERRHNHLIRVIEAVYVEHGPNIGSPALTTLLHKQHMDVSQATVARILQKHRNDWHRKHPKFHRDDQITLNFPNENDYWCPESGNFYDLDTDKEAIQSMLNSYSFNKLKKYDQEGIHDVTDFKSTDNLIIKGDNLISLHKLQQRFKRKVQLIYVDPPYNNKNYTLSYPNAYSHSTYLVFMKNRLEASKCLLTASGTIFIQCNNYNQAYLKVLCDEVFGRGNFISQIVWRRSQSQQNRGHIASVVDYILIYANNIERVKLNKFPLSDADKKNYKYEDEKGLFRLDRLADNKSGYYQYDIQTPNHQVINGIWKYPQSTFEQLLDRDEIYWSKNNYPYKKVYFHENTGKIPSDLWIDSKQYGSNQEASREINQLFGKHKFTFPKPERLMYQIIELATDKGDIVSDPFLGSATTAAVAHKTKRQYIGIERLDYIEKIAIERLKKVIAGDTGGISNKVNWNGGSSFIYAELDKHRSD